MAKSSGKATIKKYANRRLYDTESSTYITLDRLAQMIRDGREFEVVDANGRPVPTRLADELQRAFDRLRPIHFGPRFARAAPGHVHVCAAAGQFHGDGAAGPTGPACYDRRPSCQ